MQYHIGRDGQQFGQFTEEEIRQGLEGGRFLTTDLVWREGLPQWKPLNEVFGFAAAAALSAPLVSHGSVVTGPGVFPQASAGAGAGAGGPAAAYPYQQQHVGVGVMPMSGLAIGSMVVGIISLLSFIGCPIGLLLGIPGVICGHMGLAEIRRSGNQMQGKGMAIAGLIMNYVAIAIGAAVLLFVVVVVGIGAAGAAGAGAK